jgi:hypothetical protein
MLRQTVSRSVCLGIRHPFVAYNQIFIHCLTVTCLLMWGALSDERKGLSFARVTVSSSKSVVSMYNLQGICQSRLSRASHALYLITLHCLGYSGNLSI